MVSLDIHDHSDQLSDSELSGLVRRLQQGLPAILKTPGSVEAALVLSDLEIVEISIVDDKTIARVHEEFMDDPTPTDVITFQHGEILISVDTARDVVSSGKGEGSLLEELELYAIHGLLHLHGFDDLREPDRSLMHAQQARLLNLSRLNSESF